MKFKVGDEVRVKKNFGSNRKAKADYVGTITCIGKQGAWGHNETIWLDGDTEGGQWNTASNLELVKGGDMEFKVGEILHFKGGFGCSAKKGAKAKVTGYSEDNKYVSVKWLGKLANKQVNGNYYENTFEEFERSKEMNLKERIEALIGWDKEADDIIEEIRDGEALSIRITTNTHTIYLEGDALKDEIKGEFTYSSQCGKLQAFKNALLWLAEKAGKLDDKKDKLRIELVELKERIAAVEDKLGE